MSPEQQARKTELQRHLIAIYKKQAVNFSNGLLNRVFGTEADIRRIEEELLSIDPEAVLYRCWAPTERKEEPWRALRRRKTDREDPPDGPTP